MANAHRRRNSFVKIKINGRSLEKRSEIKASLVDAFQGLMSDLDSWHPNLPELPFKVIDADQVAKLEERFTKEEVWVALVGLNGDKAASPNGFPLAFWTFSWDFVKDEVMGFFKDFHERSRFVKSLNATFLVLIPKKSTVEDKKDLRPISLVGGLYKILSKVLANRIKRVL